MNLKKLSLSCLFIVSFPIFACQPGGKYYGHHNRKLSKQALRIGPDRTQQHKQDIWEQLKAKKDLKAPHSSYSQRAANYAAYANMLASAIAAQKAGELSHSSDQRTRCARPIAAALLVTLFITGQCVTASLADQTSPVYIKDYNGPLPGPGQFMCSDVDQVAHDRWCYSIQPQYTVECCNHHEHPDPQTNPVLCATSNLDGVVNDAASAPAETVENARTLARAHWRETRKTFTKRNEATHMLELVRDQNVNGTRCRIVPRIATLLNDDEIYNYNFEYAGIPFRARLYDVDERVLPIHTAMAKKIYTKFNLKRPLKLFLCNDGSFDGFGAATATIIAHNGQIYNALIEPSATLVQYSDQEQAMHLPHEATHAFQSEEEKRTGHTTGNNDEAEAEMGETLYANNGDKVGAKYDQMPLSELTQENVHEKLESNKDAGNHPAGKDQIPLKLKVNMNHHRAKQLILTEKILRACYPIDRNLAPVTNAAEACKFYDFNSICTNAASFIEAGQYVKAGETLISAAECVDKSAQRSRDHKELQAAYMNAGLLLIAKGLEQRETWQDLDNFIEGTSDSSSKYATIDYAIRERIARLMTAKHIWYQILLDF